MHALDCTRRAASGLLATSLASLAPSLAPTAPAMSSLVDAILTSDLPANAGSPSEAPTPRPRWLGPANSSVMGSSQRLPDPSDDDQMAIDPEDEVLGPRGAGRGGRPRTDLSAVPKVADEAGDQIMHAFVDFLEKYVVPRE